MRTSALTAALAAAAGASAKVITVEVGQGGVTFKPDNIKAAKGDIVDFHFDSLHNVVAGDFSKACAPASSGAFFSGDLPKGSQKYFSITVNNTEPIFFYCAVGDHCKEGMVGVINEGTNKLSDYKSAAAKTSGSAQAPKSVEGGVVSDKAASGSAAKTSTKSSKASKTSSATGTKTASASATATSKSAAAGMVGASLVSFVGVAIAGALAL